MSQKSHFIQRHSTKMNKRRASRAAKRSDPEARPEAELVGEEEGAFAGREQYARMKRSSMSW